MIIGICKKCRCTHSMPLRKSDFGLRKTGVCEIANTRLANATSLTRYKIPGEYGIRRGFGGANILIIMGLRVIIKNCVEREKYKKTNKTTTRKDKLNILLL